MSLQEYKRKRDFAKTSEPEGGVNLSPGKQFVVQKHAARRLHYDFRLELNGVLKSWAVPKGPSLDPEVKSLAVQVEDHPLDYATFEGVIPKGQYGGGTVMVWDHGVWEPLEDPEKGLKKGKLSFHLEGEKITGEWTLVRMHGKASDNGKNWLLIKKDDEAAQDSAEFDVVSEQRESVLSGRLLEQIAKDADRFWIEDKEKTRKSKSAKRKSSSKTLIEQIDVKRLSRSEMAEMPEQFDVQLATLTAKVPAGEDWLHELKLDGYRIVTLLQNGSARIATQNGNDWTKKLPEIARAVAELPVTSAVFDGEVVAVDGQGITDFQRLQNSLKKGGNRALIYYIFDLPYLQGFDLSQVSLLERKKLLARVLLAKNPENEGILRYNDHIRGQGETVIAHACRYAMEGVVSKKVDSPYQGRRTRTWLKTKCLQRQEFVIGGFTKPEGSRTGFGALLLGYYSGGKLVYCGRVGTGFTNESLHQIKEELELHRTKSPAFNNPPSGSQRRGVTWVEPVLVAEVEFTQWTEDGLLRHPVFHGLREDKLPAEVIREKPRALPRSHNLRNGRKGKQNKSLRGTKNGQHNTEKKHENSSRIAGVHLTHPQRILYPDQGITKQQLAEFYEAIADFILPHIVNRPLSLVRCPKGRQSKCFFQKHLTESMPNTLRGIEIKEKYKKSKYVLIDDLSGLISLVQMSVLELHPWPARADRLDRPDQLVFDLDPGSGTKWGAVVRGALDVRGRLADLGLQSFVRTSGGKGLHVVAPIDRRTPWENLKRFAKGIAEGLALQFPKKYVATASKTKRKGKIFIDYLRNQRGATAIACYSTRARPGAPVATPIRWDELNDRLKPDHYTVQNLPKRITALTESPWTNFFSIRQSITKSMLAEACSSLETRKGRKNA